MLIVEDCWFLFEFFSCSLNVGSIRAVITVHYQAKGMLRIRGNRYIVSCNKEIMIDIRGMLGRSDQLLSNAFIEYGNGSSCLKNHKS